MPKNKMDRSIVPASTPQSTPWAKALRCHNQSGTATSSAHIQMRATKAFAPFLAMGVKSKLLFILLVFGVP